MNYLDSSALIDFLNSDTDSHDAARSYVESRLHRSFFTPTVVLYELYRYRARQAGPDGVAELASDLDWLTPVPFTEAAAQEAACIEAELTSAGTQINAMDILIAGVVRESGGTIVTRDRDFERVEELDVESYSGENANEE